MTSSSQAFNEAVPAGAFAAWLDGGSFPIWKTVMAENTYPGGSKERVRKAGEAVRNRTSNYTDILIIDEWRAAHRPILNTFQAILRGRTKGSGIVVAQRHKRWSTIIDKLSRFPSMQLPRMDDVAGCRLIFDSLDDLYKFRENFHKAKFKHKLRNDVHKYDYVKNPKSSGYRGIHDIYEYDVNSSAGRKYKGLLIEIQYRTKYQHAWATCVEVVGFITAHQPKFSRGNDRFQTVLMYASEIISRAYEDHFSALEGVSDDDVLKEFLRIDKEIGFLDLLRAINKTKSKNELSRNKNVILIFEEGKALEVQSFRDGTDALRALFELERTRALGQDIVLVRADTSEEIRVAFKNYFSDATEFIELIDEGCQRLSGRDIHHADIEAFGPYRDVGKI